VSSSNRIAVMLGFKFRHAAITIAGIELMHRIRKGQFGLRQRSSTFGSQEGYVIIAKGSLTGCCQLSNHAVSTTPWHASGSFSPPSLVQPDPYVQRICGL
jgi:hypothetical protein